MPSGARRTKIDAPKLEAPFGHITQRELERLDQLGATSAQILTVVVLRARWNVEAQMTRDNVRNLARLAGASVPTLRRAIDWLVANGVIVEQLVPRTEGPQGAAFYYARRVLEVELWGRSPERPIDLSEARERVMAGGR